MKGSLFCTKLLQCLRNETFFSGKQQFHGEEFKVRPFLKHKKSLLTLRKCFLQKQAKPIQYIFISCFLASADIAFYGKLRNLSVNYKKKSSSFSGHMFFMVRISERVPSIFTEQPSNLTVRLQKLLPGGQTSQTNKEVDFKLSNL